MCTLSLFARHPHHKHGRHVPGSFKVSVSNFLIFLGFIFGNGKYFQSFFTLLFIFVISRLFVNISVSYPVSHRGIGS